MKRNTGIIHPIPRMFVFAIVAIAAAFALTFLQVSLLRAVGIGNSNSSSDTANIATYSQPAVSDAQSKIDNENIVSTFSATDLAISARLTLLGINLAAVCVVTFILILGSPQTLRRLFFGSAFVGTAYRREMQRFDQEQARQRPASIHNSSGMVGGRVSPPSKRAIRRV